MLILFIRIRMVRLGVELSQCSATVYTTIHGVTCQKTYPLLSFLSDLLAYRHCARTKNGVLWMVQMMALEAFHRQLLCLHPVSSD